MEAYRERLGKAPLILNLGTRLRQGGSQRRSGRFGKEKNLFTYQDSNSRSFSP